MSHLREQLHLLGIPRNDISNYELVLPNQTGPNIGFSPQHQATCGFHITEKFATNELAVGLNKWGFIPSPPHNGQRFFIFDNKYPFNTYRENTITGRLFVGREIIITPLTYRTVIEPFMGGFNDPSPAPEITRSSLLIILLFHHIHHTASSKQLNKIWSEAKIPGSFYNWLIAAKNSHILPSYG